MTSPVRNHQNLYSCQTRERNKYLGLTEEKLYRFQKKKIRNFTQGSVFPGQEDS